MTPGDLDYFRLCHRIGLVRDPFLDVGSAKVAGSRSAENLGDVARGLGVRHTVGVDVAPGPGVDLVHDFGLPAEEFRRVWTQPPFASAGVFNVLEHTYEPATVLGNALSCVAPGGTLLVVSPVLWMLHDYPRDYVRLLPHWYEEFAARHGLTLVPDAFRWISAFGLTDVRSLANGGQYQLPGFQTLGRRQNPLRWFVTRATNFALNTYGRSHHHLTFLALGVAFTNP